MELNVPVGFIPPSPHLALTDFEDSALSKKTKERAKKGKKIIRLTPSQKANDVHTAESWTGPTASETGSGLLGVLSGRLFTIPNLLSGTDPNQRRRGAGMVYQLRDGPQHHIRVDTRD